MNQATTESIPLEIVTTPVGTTPGRHVPTASLTNSPSTLSARADRIRAYHEGVKTGFRSQMCYAFLSGVELLAADQEAVHGTFLKWKQENFPDISNATLSNYANFSKALLTKFPTVGNLVPQLQIGVGETLTEEQRDVVMAAVHEAADGKTLTELYRDLGVIRQPKAKEFHPPNVTPEEAAAQQEQLTDEHLLSGITDMALTRSDEFAARATKARAKEYLDAAVTTAAFWRNWLKTQKQSKKSTTKKK